MQWNGVVRGSETILKSRGTRAEVSEKALGDHRTWRGDELLRLNFVRDVTLKSREKQSQLRREENEGNEDEGRTRSFAPRFKYLAPANSRDLRPMRVM